MSENKILYNYRVFCIEEQQNRSVWSIDPPTMCPNDHADRTIDTNRTTIVDAISKQHVITDDGLTGSYQVINIHYQIPAGSPGDVSIHDVSWPMDLEIWKSKFKPTEEHIGDIGNFIVYPDTIVGILTATATSGSNILTVTPETTDLSMGLVKGHELMLNDTVTTFNAGRIIGINRETFQITMENNLPQNFSAGTLIVFNAYMVKDYKITNTEFFILGEKGFKATLLPANIIIRLKYTNMSGNAKDVYIHTEYYYS